MERAYQWIESDEQLLQLLPTLKHTPILGIDTESNNYHAYVSELCLLQLATPDAQYVLDPLALSQEAIGQLGPLLEDPRIIKVFHGADNDLSYLWNQYGFKVNGLFDTILAARFLNQPKRGLSDLIERYFGVKISKKYQRFDWSIRPLPTDAVDYAVGDVFYLLELYSIFVEELQEAGRLDAVLQESHQLTLRDFTPKPFDPQGFRRLKGAKGLTQRQQDVLYALFMWRHRYCTEINRAAFLVLDNATLIELALKQPKHPRDLKRLRRLSPKQARWFGDDLLNAIDQGHEQTAPPKPPRSSSRKGPKLSMRQQELQAQRYDQLKLWREEVAAEQAFELDLVATNQTLQEIAKDRPKDMESLSQIPGMLPWRCDRFGRDLLRITKRG